MENRAHQGLGLGSLPVCKRWKLMGHEVRNQATTCTEGDAEGRTEKMESIWGTNGRYFHNYSKGHAY